MPKVYSTTTIFPFSYFYLFPPFTPSAFDTLGHDLAPVCETPVPEVKMQNHWSIGRMGCGTVLPGQRYEAADLGLAPRQCAASKMHGFRLTFRRLFTMSEWLDTSVLYTVRSMGKTGADSYHRARLNGHTVPCRSLFFPIPISRYSKSLENASRSHAPVLHASSRAQRSRHLVKTRDAQVLRGRYVFFPLKRAAFPRATPRRAS